jgi:2C-methyl-D-erythritol 2,4-cyclodiphosphate synthase
VLVVEHVLCNIDLICVVSKDSNINTTLVVEKTKLKHYFLTEQMWISRFITIAMESMTIKMRQTD